MFVRSLRHGDKSGIIGGMTTIDRGFTAQRALGLAKEAFDAVITMGMGVGVHLEVERPRGGEPVLAFSPARGSGILHEDVLTIVSIAAKYEGRLWIQNAAEWSGLAILWPVYDPPGPGGAEAESPAKKTRRVARGG